MEQPTVTLPHYEVLLDQYEIYEYLNLENKEHLIFNYNNIKTFDDLQLYSFSLLNQSVLGVSNVHDSGITVQYTSPHEKEKSLIAAEKGLTNIGLDDVKYTVSKLGYRLTHPLDTIPQGIGIFGCSITYGIGMSEDKLFINLLEKEVQKPLHNFGIPGASIQKIAKCFISINNFYKLKKAIFLLPAMHRFEYIGEEEVKGKNLIFSESYIPSFEPINKSRREVYKLVYGNFHEVTFFDEYIKMLTLVLQNAKLNGTEVTFFTWDFKVQELVQKFKVQGLEEIGKLHFPENEDAFKGNKVTDFARDGAHPGLRSQKAMFELILPAFGKKKLL